MITSTGHFSFFLFPISCFLVQRQVMYSEIGHLTKCLKPFMHVKVKLSRAQITVKIVHTCTCIPLVVKGCIAIWLFSMFV